MNTSIIQFGLAPFHQTQLIAKMTGNTIANTIALVLVVLILSSQIANAVKCQQTYSLAIFYLYFKEIFQSTFTTFENI